MLTNTNYIPREQAIRMCEITAVKVCEMFGVNAVVSYSQGVARYGTFFKDMVRAKRLVPRYAGKGSTGKRQFAVRDILALIDEEAAKAELI